MNVQPGYNPEKRGVTLSVESNLIKRYFPNFSGMVKENPSVPKDTEVELFDERTAVITFPLDPSSSIVKAGENSMAIGISSDKMEVFQDIINSFANCALRKELRTTEFIPLYGYPKENLKVDIQNAVKNKRKLCVIKDYSEYTAMSEGKSGKYIFHQVMVEYGTPEYTEASILLYNEDMKSLRNMFEDRLVLENWC
jgi:hypothetical protein